jgi:hypothetical protein
VDERPEAARAHHPPPRFSGIGPDVAALRALELRALLLNLGFGLSLDEVGVPGALEAHAALDVPPALEGLKVPGPYDVPAVGALNSTRSTAAPPASGPGPLIATCMGWKLI